MHDLTLAAVFFGGMLFGFFLAADCLMRGRKR